MPGNLRRLGFKPAMQANEHWPAMQANQHQFWPAMKAKQNRNWPTMQASTAATDSDPDTSTKSFMCITKASAGGVCMEAIIGASENTVNTYYIPSADLTTKLTTP